MYRRVLLVALFFFSLAVVAAPIKKGETIFVKGIPVMVKGLALPLKPEPAAVETFITKEFFGAYGLGKDLTLIPMGKVTLGGTTIFKYRSAYKGWLVEGAYTSVSLRNGKVYRITNGIGKINLDLSRVVPTDLAVKAAMKRHFPQMPAGIAPNMVEKVIVKIGEIYMPAYKVRLIPFHMADNRIYYVHAKSGKLLYVQNKVMFDDTDVLLPDESVTPLDTAKVYEKNPITTPDLTEVTLPDVAAADDPDLAANAQGFLTGAKDENGIRRIKGWNCPDKGEKFPISFGGYNVTPHLCSPTQLANKKVNGSFIYEDCEGGKEYDAEKTSEDKVDRCAEIAMYYHASKIYDYLRSLGTDFKHLKNNTVAAPLNVIGNFLMPDMSNLMAIFTGDNALVPMDNAFFSPDNPLLTLLFANIGISGDLLVFGQGTFADFAMDGDVVYHEFGHATVYTTGLDSGGFLDQYGMNNEPGALHEGFGDTFSFLISEDPCTGEYASDGLIKWANSQGGIIEMDQYEVGNKKYWCMRYAEHEYKVVEDWEGEVHWDGQPHLAASWAIWKLTQEKNIGGTTLQLQKDAFTKLILKTLYSLHDAAATHKLWADTLLSEVENDSNYKNYKSDVQKILTDFNYFTEIRARTVVNNNIKRQFVDAAVDPEAQNGLFGGGTVIQTMEGEEAVSIMPAYLQMVYTVPNDFEFNAVRVTAGVQATSGSNPIGGGGTPDLHIYVRKDNPIIYEVDEENSSSGVIVVKIDYDTHIVKDTSKNAWYLPGVKPGEKYYFQFVNYGFGGAQVNGITFAGENYTPPVNDEDTVGDDEDEIGGDEIAVADEDEITDTTVVPDADTSKKSSSGCGCSMVF